MGGPGRWVWAIFEGDEAVVAPVAGNGKEIGRGLVLGATRKKDLGVVSAIFTTGEHGRATLTYPAFLPRYLQNVDECQIANEQETGKWPVKLQNIRPVYDWLR